MKSYRILKRNGKYRIQYKTKIWPFWRWYRFANKIDEFNALPKDYVIALIEKDKKDKNKWSQVWPVKETKTFQDLTDKDIEADAHSFSIRVY